MFSVWYGLMLCSGVFGAFRGLDVCVCETVAIETLYFMLVGKLLAFRNCGHVDFFGAMIVAKRIMLVSCLETLLLSSSFNNVAKFSPLFILPVVPAIT